MAYALLKLLLSASIIVAVSEIAKRSSLLGGLIASLPLTSLLAFIWLYAETRDKDQVAALSNSIFWLIVPSLSFFIVFPTLLKRLDFVWALVASIAIMLVFYYLTVFALNRLGIAI